MKMRGAERIARVRPEDSSDTKKQVEIGSLAPIEVVRAQSTVAQDQQLVTSARTNLQLQQLLMKNALTRTLKDPVLATAEVIPTSTMSVPARKSRTHARLDQPGSDSSRGTRGVAYRLEQPRTQQQVGTEFALADFDLFAYYGGSGVGGSQKPANLCSNLDSFLTGIGCAVTPTPSVATATLSINL